MTLLERLFQEAEELDPDDRERLAWMLMQSATYRSEADASDFEAELDKRIALIDSGEAKMTEWTDLRRELWKGLDSRR